MAQVYVPEDPRVRDQLQQGGIPAELLEQPHRRVKRRRYGVIDLVVLLSVIAAITLLVLAAARWTAPQTPVVSIDLSPAALPAYAGYSLLRMILAYLLSLVFTLVYGHIAATNRRAETVMVPILDILQSIPILSFLPIVTLALVAAFPHSNIGLELASVILIFTSQAWNMTFSFYHSARTQPTDLREATAIYQASCWRKWRTLILPAIFPYLVTGLLTASGGAWNASIVSEYVQFANHTVSTIGLGASIAEAVAANNFSELLAATLLMALFVVALNRLVWKRLYVLAERRYTLA